MAYVYVLYSEKLKRFYTGSCADIKERMTHHSEKKYINSFTAKADDWVLYYSHGGLSQNQSRQVERHIKRMRSKKYMENLKQYPEIMDKLKKKYE